MSHRTFVTAVLFPSDIQWLSHSLLSWYPCPAVGIHDIQTEFQYAGCKKQWGRRESKKGREIQCYQFTGFSWVRWGLLEYLNRWKKRPDLNFIKDHSSHCVEKISQARGGREGLTAEKKVIRVKGQDKFKGIMVLSWKQTQFADRCKTENVKFRITPKFWLEHLEKCNFHEMRREDCGDRRTAVPFLSSIKDPFLKRWFSIIGGEDDLLLFF